MTERSCKDCAGFRDSMDYDIDYFCTVYHQNIIIDTDDVETDDLQTFYDNRLIEEAKDCPAHKQKKEGDN